MRKSQRPQRNWRLIKLAQTQARLANEDNPTYETDQALRDADEQVAIAQSPTQ